MPIFSELSDFVSKKLIQFVDRRNIGKEIEIDEIVYTLDFISQNSSSFFKSRSLSVYFTTADDVIRISDHWAKSNHHERSRKLNCGWIDGHVWEIDNKSRSKLEMKRYAGKYPWVMLAGRASKLELNSSCKHWR